MRAAVRASRRQASYETNMIIRLRSNPKPGGLPWTFGLQGDVAPSRRDPGERPRCRCVLVLSKRDQLLGVVVKDSCAGGRVGDRRLDCGA